jgi:serine protease AprX
MKTKGRILPPLLFTALLLNVTLSTSPPAYALNESISAIRAPEAWATGSRGQGVTVAIIDFGFDKYHEDLEGAIRYTYNPVSNDTYVGAMPGYGNDVVHGTHIAGIIAGRGTESGGRYKGVAPEAQLVLVKVPALEPDRLDEAVRWVIANQYVYDIKVLSSNVNPDENYGGNGRESPYSIALDQAVENGIVVVQSAGNVGHLGPRTILNGGNAFNVITVGAIDDKNTPRIDDDELAYYPDGFTYKGKYWPPWGSSKGTTEDGRPKPDVVAPGVHIWSLRGFGTSQDMYEDVEEDTAYGELSGTSVAAPHVAGVVALMLEANPFLTPAQVKAILRQTARLNTNLSGLTVNDRGYGIVDAYAAVQLARTPLWINATFMYDSWTVETLHKELTPTWESWNYLTFTVDAASARFGIGLSNIQYHFRDNWGYTQVDYSLLNSLSATHVWIDNTYHNLGLNMSQYLFTGPRIWASGPGYIRMRAIYLIDDVFIEYSWKMDVDEMYLRLYFSQIPSWTVLIYIDPSVYDSTNYPYLPSTSEKAMYETTIIGDVLLDIRNADPGQTDYIEIDPVSTDNPRMHVIKYGYFGTDPSSVQNYEYIYNQDIVVYYRAGTAVLMPDPGPSIHRKTNPLIDPSPTQDDADTGGDAGNNFTTATVVNMPVSQRGILCYSDPVDTEDWYQFYVDQGATIVASMTPSYGIDFNLELYSPTGVLIAGSYLGPSFTDSISLIANSAGYWRIRIYLVSGEALYYFSIMNPHGQGGGHPPNMPDSVDPGTES